MAELKLPLGDLEGRAPLHAALAIWLVASAVMLWALPALPVDETRYLTVAWEMKLSGHWLLPTLNGEPYSHKPPLLFWLINLAWSVFGTEVWTARLVPVLASAGVLAMTFRLARELIPEERGTAGLAALILLVPATFLYGSLIMFDQLLTLSILIGLLALWRAANAPSRGTWLVLGLALGLGLLAKGPVVLVHLLPPALLVAYWKPPEAVIDRKRWYGSLIVAIAIGAAIILAWAIPAAISGGPKFAEMIFWKQSAGRMVQSFHHRQPIWFYLPVIAVFLLPLFFWRPLWRALAKARREPLPRSALFLLSWIVPAVLFFTLISGKQPHYLLPLLPGVAVLAAILLRKESARPGDAALLAVPFAVLFLILAAGPTVAALAGLDTPTGYVSEGIARFDPLLSLAAGALALVALGLARDLGAQALAMGLAGALLITTVAVQARNHLFRFYDFAPLARALEPLKDRPLAVFNQYAGEYGFAARLEKPLEVRNQGELRAWFAEHPDGAAVVRHGDTDEVKDFTVVHSQPFRTSKRISILRPKGS